jgi:hypothetical protein
VSRVALKTHHALTRNIDKQVFPSLEFIGWYTVASVPTIRHIALHEQVAMLMNTLEPQLNQSA